MAGNEDSIKNDDNNEIKPVKRPISLTLIILLGVLFLLILLFAIFPLKNFSISTFMIPFFIFMPVSLIISLILIGRNRKKNQKRTKGFIISSVASFVLLILAITFMAVFADSLVTGNSLFNRKQYESAILQYNSVIKQNKDLNKVELSKNKIIEAQNFIDQAKNFMDKGDSYFKDNLFDKAIIEYDKAKEIYPYLKGLNKKISDAKSKIEFTSQSIVAAQKEKDKINNTTAEIVKLTTTTTEIAKPATTTTKSNNPPVAKIDFSENDVMKNKEVTFNSSSTDPDGDALSYEWALPDGTKSTQQSVSYIFKNSGSYNISLTVSDGKLESTSQAVVNVKNNTPVAKIDFSENIVMKNKEVTFRSSSTDLDGDALSYEWTLPDGTKLTQQSISYTFKEFGSYEISLAVSDGESQNLVKKTINVENQNPIAVIAPINTAYCNTGDIIHFSAEGSSDPEGSKITYKWDLPDGSTKTTKEIDYKVNEAGTLEISLTVSDGELNDTVTTSLEATETPEYFKKSCIDVSYGELMRYPDKYSGKRIHIKGEVVQKLSETQFHINITNKGYGFWDDRTWLVTDAAIDCPVIIENDLIEIWGLGAGVQEYETVLHANVTIPLILAKYVNITTKAENR